MQQKLVFTIPDADIGKLVVNSLHNYGLEDDQISFIACEDVVLEALPSPGEYENGVVPAAKRGALFGGVTGLVAGMGATVVAPGVVLGGAALALAATGGAAFGVLASAMVGSSVDNSEVGDYESALKLGELLMVVEVGELERARLVRDGLSAAYPQIRFEEIIDSTFTPLV